MHGRIHVLAETQEWLEANSNGAVLHRHVKTLDKPSKIEQLGLDINIPNGYVCSNVEDLLVSLVSISPSLYLPPPPRRTRMLCQENTFGGKQK